MEYRAFREDEKELFYRMTNYAFLPEDGEKDHQDPENQWEIYGELRGMFNRDWLLTCYELFELSCQLRGAWFKLGGIGAVASPPENRRKGYIGDMLRGSINEMKERGMALSALWPFSYSFYRKYGWEKATDFKRYTIEPPSLKFADQPRGEFVKMEQENLLDLNKIYNHYHLGYDLKLDRDDQWWERIYSRKGKRSKFVYFWQENGENRAYVIYTIKKLQDDPWDKELIVREMGVSDYIAYRQLLRFIYYHDSQVRRFKFEVPSHDPLLKIMPEPRISENKYMTGAMFRVIDVAQVFSQINYHDSIDYKLYFKVNDQQAEWNDGIFLLEVKDGQGKCQRTNDNQEWDFEIDINRLASLLTGFMPSDEAYALGYLKTREPEVINYLNKLLPARKTFFNEYF